MIPHATPDCIDLIVRLLKYDVTERITAKVCSETQRERDGVGDGERVGR